MDYQVFVGISWETNDMGISNRGSSQKEIPVTDIVPGFNLLGRYEHAPCATVVSFQDGCLSFEFSGKTVTVQAGHTWNSPMCRVDNPYLYEAEGYMISIKIPHLPKEEKRAAKRAIAILDKMRNNAEEELSPTWKNIPLGRELLDILQNKLPVSGDYMDATERIFVIDYIFIHNLLEERDVPRLLLEFLQLRKLAMPQQKETDTHFPSECNMGVREADRIQNRLDLYISPNITTDWWIDYVDATLNFDPVQRTEKWEEVIYDVEKACDSKLRGVPRGMGFCFEYWSVKKAELAKRGIEWRTPHQMNPRVMFD